MSSETMRQIEIHSGPRMNPDELVRAAKQIPVDKLAEIKDLLSDISAALDKKEEVEQ